MFLLKLIIDIKSSEMAHDVQFLNVFAWKKNINLPIQDEYTGTYVQKMCGEWPYSFVTIVVANVKILLNNADLVQCFSTL